MNKPIPAIQHYNIPQSIVFGAERSYIFNVPEKMFSPITRPYMAIPNWLVSTIEFLGIEVIKPDTPKG